MFIMLHCCLALFVLLKPTNGPNQKCAHSRQEDVTKSKKNAYCYCNLWPRIDSVVQCMALCLLHLSHNSSLLWKKKQENVPTADLKVHCVGFGRHCCNGIYIIMFLLLYNHPKVSFSLILEWALHISIGSACSSTHSLQCWAILSL